MNSLTTFTCGLLRMETPVLTNQQKHYQLCVDTGYSLEDLPKAMAERERERERVKGEGEGA